MLTNFQKSILYVAKLIPKGKVTTYGEIAKALKTSPRAVGRALGKNPCPIKIPCHRVVKSDGSLGGYSGGVQKKKRLLEKEGIKIKGNRLVDFIRYFFKLKTKN